MSVWDGLDNLFMHHAPSKMEVERYEKIRAAGKAFARVILDETPVSADQAVAIRNVREAVMWANASIACYGDPLTPPSPRTSE